MKIPLNIKVSASSVYSRILLLLTLLALSGCATTMMNKKECINSDWYAIGFEDGARGALASHIGQHRKACAAHDIQPDLRAYNNGRQIGLKEYCRPSAGRKDNNYSSVCPKAIGADSLLRQIMGSLFKTCPD